MALLEKDKSKSNELVAVAKQVNSRAKKLREHVSTGKDPFPSETLTRRTMVEDFEKLAPNLLMDTMDMLVRGNDFRHHRGEEKRALYAEAKKVEACVHLMFMASSRSLLLNIHFRMTFTLRGMTHGRSNADTSGVKKLGQGAAVTTARTAICDHRALVVKKTTDDFKDSPCDIHFVFFDNEVLHHDGIPFHMAVLGYMYPPEQYLKKGLEEGLSDLPGRFICIGPTYLQGKQPNKLLFQCYPMLVSGARSVRALVLEGEGGENELALPVITSLIPLAPLPKSNSQRFLVNQQLVLVELICAADTLSAAPMIFTNSTVARCPFDPKKTQAQVLAESRRGIHKRLLRNAAYHWGSLSGLTGKAGQM